MIRLYSAFCGYLNSNSGDSAGAGIIRRLFNAEVEVSDDKKRLGYNTTKIVGIGSIAEDIPRGYSGWVWGTGVMHEHSRIDTPEAKVMAVRGHLTRSRWHQVKNASVVLGDPGLLVDVAFKIKKADNPKYAVGIIPHYVDYQDMGVREFLRRNPDAVGIDICGRPQDVLRAISECEIILSSSLHGLVFADALKIPNLWITISDGLIGGGTFKFRDYFTNFAIWDPLALAFNPGMSVDDIRSFVDGYSRPGLDGIKASLIDAFPKELLKEEVANEVEPK